MVRKDAWNDFYFFEFTNASFMAQDVIYPGEGSMCTLEKVEICSGMKSSFSRWMGIGQQQEVTQRWGGTVSRH